MNLGDMLTIYLGVDLANLTAGLEKAKQQVASYSASVNQFGQGLAQAGTNSISGWSTFSETLKPIRDNMSEILSVANRMSLTAMRTILAGGAALAVAYFPTKEAIEFEKQMAVVAGVSKASSDQMKNLRDVAIQMGRETIFSATQASQAMTSLAKSGFTANEIITMLPATMQLAAATGLDMAQAAETAAAAIRGFNLTAIDMTHVADVIAASTNKSTISALNMSDSLKYVAPAATAAGMGINETAAAISVLGNAGIRGSMAGTTLRQILMRLTDDSKSFSDALNRLGVQAYDITGKMKPFTEIISDLAKSNVGMTQIGQVFTARSAAGVAALVNNVDMLQRFTFENQNAAGEAKRLSDVMLNNVAGSLEYLKSSIASLSIAVAGPLLAGFKMLIDVLSEVINTMQRVAAFPLFEAMNKTLGYTIGALGSVLTVLTGIAGVILSPVLTPLIAIAAAMGGLLLVMGGTGIMVSGFLRAMLFLTDGLKIFSGTFMAAKTELLAFSLAASPVGNIILSIWGALKAGAGAILAGGWWTIIAIGIGTIVTALYLWYTWQDRVATKAKNLADQSSINRKSFDEMTASLGKTAIGTAEHDKIIDELLKKYPELAGRIRYTNQSWEEQQQILNSFRTELLVKEVETAVKSMELAAKKLEELNKQRANFKVLPERPTPYVPGGLAPPTEAWEKRGKEAAALTPGLLFPQQEDIDKARANIELAQRKITDDARLQESEIRTRMQAALDAIDWKALGKKPIDIIKAPREAFDELFKISRDTGAKISGSLTPTFSENEASVRRVVDALQSGGTPIQKWVDLLMQATDEMRRQNELLDSRRTRPSTDVNLVAATQEASLLINRFNMLPQSLREAKTAAGETVQEVIAGIIDPKTGNIQVAGLITNMMHQMAMFGPEATRLMANDVDKALKKWNELPPGFKIGADVIIAEFKNIGASWDKYVAQVMSKPLSVNLPAFGGINPLEPAYQQIPRLESGIELKDWLKQNAAGAKYLTQELAAAFITFNRGAKDVAQTGKMDFSGFSREAQARANAIAEVIRSQTDLSREAISGIIGNIYQETGGTFSPTAVNPKSGAFGIAQWLGSRKTALIQALGSQKDDLIAQANYLVAELKRDYGKVYSDLQKAESPEAATKIFELGFEKSGANEKAWNTRIGTAKAWYGQAVEMAGGIQKLNDQLGRFAGESDQVRKGIAAALIELPEEIPVYKPFKQIVEEAKKDGKVWANTIESAVDEVLRTQEKLGKEGGSAIFIKMNAQEVATQAKTASQITENIRLRGGMDTEDALARQRDLRLTEYAAKRKAALADVQAAEISPDTLNKQSKIDEAKKKVRELDDQNKLDLAQFELTTAREISQLNIYKIQERQQIAQNELAAAESIVSLHKAELDAEREVLRTRLSMGTISGTEFAGKNIEIENQLYRDQLALLDKRAVIAKIMEDLAIAEARAKADSQPREATTAQIIKAQLDYEKDILDIQNKKKEATAKNIVDMEKIVQLAQKARLELAGVGVDLMTKFAWGPIQERYANLVKNAKEFGDLTRRINEMEIIPKDLKPGETFKADPNFVATVQAMADAAAILQSPWAQPLADAVQELSGPITAEKANQIKQQIQLEIIPQVKAEGDFQIKYKDQIDAGARAITDGITSMIDAMMGGGKDIKAAANTMFKNLFKASITEGLKQLEQLLINGFKKLFESVGSSVGGAFGGAIMGAIGLVGMMLTSKTSATATPTGVQSAVTSTEPVRGIIAGPTSIPIAQIGVSLQDALVTTNGILKQIESNTRGGLAVSVNAVGMSNLESMIRDAMDNYFRNYLAMGSTG